MLSVIICTYNRQKYIYNCLKSIAENDFDASKYEKNLIENLSRAGARMMGFCKSTFFKRITSLLHKKSISRNGYIETGGLI